MYQSDSPFHWAQRQLLLQICAAAQTLPDPVEGSGLQKREPLLRGRVGSLNPKGRLKKRPRVLS